MQGLVSPAASADHGCAQAAFADQGVELEAAGGVVAGEDERVQGTSNCAAPLDPEENSARAPVDHPTRVARSPEADQNLCFGGYNSGTRVSSAFSKPRHPAPGV